MGTQTVACSAEDCRYLLDLANTIDFEKAYRNVKHTPQRENGSGLANSISVGISKAYQASAKPTISLPLTRILTKEQRGPQFVSHLNRIMLSYFPDHKYTTIMMNKNFGGALHVDKNNVGDSVMLTIGDDIQGGDLFMYDYKNREAHVYPTKNQFLKFDGDNPHATMPYTGTRYSFVFFNHASYTRDPLQYPEQKKLMEQLHYGLPDRTVSRGLLTKKLAELPQRKHRMSQARELEENARAEYSALTSPGL